MKNNIVFFIAAVFFMSCTHQKEDTATDKPFCISDSLMKKIVISTAENETIRNEIRLSGKIEANEDKMVKIFPVVNGVVQQLNVQLGDYVHKGQTLAVVRSTELADYQSQSVSASAAVRVAEKSLSSAKDMAASGLATQKDVIAAEADLERAKAEMNRSGQAISISRAKGNAMQTITAPVSGYIIEKNVTDDMQYKTDGAQPFFVIADLDEVWVIANVFESDIAKIKTGYDADIKVIAYNDKVFKGKVDRIFPILDPQSRVMKVRIRIKNEDNLLKPEMFAQINISYEDASEKQIAVPATSVIFDKNKNFVMVYRDRCKVETREVEAGETVGDRIYIKSGLQPGDKVISKYQLMLYDALNDQ